MKECACCTNYRKSRRLKVMKIAPIMLERMFRTDATIERTQVLQGLPEDAQIRDAFYKEGDNEIRLIIWSKEFDMVPDGTHAPEMDPIVLKRL